LIRSAAARALLQLSGDPRWGQLLLELLRHPQLQVRRAALMDLGAVGWRPALEPIRATLAENSLKLIALRGLAERQPVSLQPASQPNTLPSATLHSVSLQSGRRQPDSLPFESPPFETNRPASSLPTTGLSKPHADRDPLNSPRACQLPDQHSDLHVDEELEAVLDVMDALL
jgi:hypothetical protein